jgi:type II secretory pathway pseudopilin PulG
MQVLFSNRHSLPISALISAFCILPPVKRPSRSCLHLSRAGFTLFELLFGTGVLVLLLAVFVPYVISVRAINQRTACAEHLRALNDALHAYAADNHYDFPRVRYDAVHNANGYRSFTGADSTDPFASSSDVAANDVTASLWLLLREGYVKDPATFVCPASGDMPDIMFDATHRPTDVKRRANFRSGENLSYSYAQPFSSAWQYKLNSDRLPAQFAVMADKNAGFPDSDGEKILGPSRDAPPFALANANSRNHARVGQNVLYAAGDLSFEQTPYCGVANDNIFSAVSPKPLGKETVGFFQLDGPGYWGYGVGPGYEYDSDLVPTAGEGQSGGQ